ncbi:sigma-70 family RNA polymerase sigma factor [Nocardiopsis oceani]
MNRSARATLPTTGNTPVDGEAEDMLSKLRGLPRDGSTARELRSRIAHLHTKVVFREAGRYRNRGVDTEELRQIASLGLMKAIAGFDPGHGKRFVSYLLPTVSGEIKRHFRDNVWAVHVPRSYRDRRAELNRFVVDYTQDHAKPPTQTEIGAHFGTDSRATGELINAASAYSALSLDLPQGHDEEGSEEILGDALGGADRELELVVDRTVLRSALTRLPPVQRRVVVLSYFDEKPQTEIAGLLGCSQMQVSRLLRGALDELRKELVLVDCPNPDP